MTEGREFDVIVVGAGPAGSACSTVLAQHGSNVLLIDKARFPRDKICGDCIHPFSWHFFDLLGVSDQLRSRELRPISAVRIVNTRGYEVVVETPSRVSAPFIALKRQVLDGILLGNAEQSGVSIIQDGRIIAITNNGAWSVAVQTAGGREYYRARYLVGADGRNSYVAGQINAQTWNHAASKTVNRVGVQWHASYQMKVGTQIHLLKFDSGYGGIVNVDDSTANVALVVPPSIARLARSDFPQFLERTLLRNPACATMTGNLVPPGFVHTAFPIDPVIRRSRRSDAFLVGDARRTVEPFTGEGIRFSLQDGILTANRILRLTGRKSGPTRFRTRSPFWVNSVYSPILRSHRATESLITLASNQPWLSRLMNRTVFESGIW